MTVRTCILAGLVAGVAVPAVAYAARSGLTKYDVDHGNVQLLSQRNATSTTTASRRPQQAHGRSDSTASSEDARHNDATDKGLVKMTQGSLPGGEKK